MKINERKIDIDAETKSKEKEIVNMSETKHSVIVTTVNQGYSEEVMNAARSNGAKGGTVFHTNCIINDETMNFWNLDFNEEKETVLIITDNDKKLGIMKAISESCGINTKANGLVLSIPIDNIMGINTGEH